MSLHLLASGALIADPQRRSGAKGEFATATLRVATGDDAILVSVLAFGDLAERLLQLGQGAPVSVSGRASLRTWTGKDGAERTGLSVVASEIAAVRPRPHDLAPRRARPTSRPPLGPPPDDPLDDPLDDIYPDARR